MVFAFDMFERNHTSPPQSNVASFVISVSVLSLLAVFFFKFASASAGASDTYSNPIIADGADPWVIRKDGFYFYTHTTGNNVRIRKAARITGTNGLAAASPVTVFTPPAPNHQAVWAPELHFLQGKWYIYYAADNGTNANHRMYVAEANSSNAQGSYAFKGKIFDATTDRWAIDGTVLQMTNGALYFIWSGWPGSVDGQQNLYIAPMSNPWTISGPRVRISTPAHPWEGWIQEGSQVIQRNGKIMIVYSANASWTDNYCLGLLVNTDGNVLNASSWNKMAVPVFRRYSDLNGSIFGPGHCSFVKSVDGVEDFMFYHAAKFSGAGWNRDVRVQRFSWNADDTPALDVPIPTTISLTAPSGERPVPAPETIYSLSANTGAGGVRKAPDQLGYQPGSVVTFTAHDYEGIVFTGWSGDAWGTNESIEVLADRSKIITANFHYPLVLLDNTNASLTGTWTSSSLSTERFGADYQYAHTTPAPLHHARFRPNISTAGRYDIYVYYSAGPNRSTVARWSISDADTVTTLLVNQQTNGGVWLLLAEGRRFASGTNGFVQLSSNTGETNKVVIADAVAFVYSARQDAPPILLSSPLSQTVPLGSNVTLRVAALGGPDYQWHFAGVNLAGATTSTLTIANFNPGQEGFYQVSLSNSFGTVVSSLAELRLSSPLRMGMPDLTSAGYLVRLSGGMGYRYVLESSSNLEQWTRIQTNLSINGFVEFHDSGTNAAGRFYRAFPVVSP